MKKHFIYILTLLILTISLIGSIHQKNDKTDLEKVNLSSDVKRVKTFENVIVKDRELVEELVLDYEYNSNGNLIRELHYSDSNLVFEIDYEYENEYLVRSKKIDKKFGMNSSSSFTNNKDGYPVETILEFEKLSSTKLLSKYDHNNYLKSQKIINGNDTSNIVYTNIYYPNNKIRSIEKIQKKGRKFLSALTKYKYDDEGRISEMLIEIDNSSAVDRKLIIYKYHSNGKAESITEFKNSKLDLVTYFDIHGNEIEIKTYQNASISKWEKFKYSYDDKGNWIEKYFLKMDVGKGDDKLKKYLKHRREIEYKG